MNAADPHAIDDTCLRAAVAALRARQVEAGSMPCDYSGPLFLPGMYVGTCYALGALPEGPDRDGFIAYLRATQSPDGGWGLGEQNPSAVFTTSLSYMALRMLGVAAEDPDLVRARAWLHARGGARTSASWGRFFLSLMRLHPWEGCDPVPPELWLLPYALPVHPGRMWCHARMVYLPMGWLYATRATLPDDPLLAALRTELYVEDWDAVDWRAARDVVAPEDAYHPRTRAYKLVRTALDGLERVMPRRLRARALAEVERQVAYEDDLSGNICIGPVNKLYNTLLWHFKEPGGERARAHLAKLPDYLWRDARGVRMNGYNSSELWDAAFAAQALLEIDAPWADDVLEGLWRFIRAQRLDDNPPDAARHYRTHSAGGWPFSNRPHGWPITDCTAEGLKTSVLLRQRRPDAAAGHLDDASHRASVRALLAWQNPDGGWASYEQQRAPRWLEAFNPSDIFGDIMVDASFVECTSAVLQALHAWRDDPLRQPDASDPDVDDALRRGAAFLRAQQRPDGGWYGNWAVCFTYGTWFGIHGLLAAGAPPEDPAIQRAADFLEGLQRPDGAWGEHIDSCRQKEPVPTADGQSVMTAWAVLALVAAGRARARSACRGVSWLREQQGSDGTWHDTAIAGVFNRTCSIHYDSYARVFPPWALAAWTRAARGTA
jgi:squalene/oxidosqualene cyclase-like protein